MDVDQYMLGMSQMTKLKKPIYRIWHKRFPIRDTLKAIDQIAAEISASHELSNTLGLDIGSGTFEYSDSFHHIPTLAIDSFKEEHEKRLDVADTEIQPLLSFLTTNNIKFDFIFSRWVLNYFHDRVTLLKMLQSSVSKQGKMYFIEQSVAPIYDTENNYSSVSIKEMKDAANILNLDLRVQLLSTVMECLNFQLNDVVDSLFSNRLLKLVFYVIINSVCDVLNKVTRARKSNRMCHSILFVFSPRR